MDEYLDLTSELIYKIEYMCVCVCVFSKEVSSIIFESLEWLDLGLNSNLPGHKYIYIYIIPLAYIYIYIYIYIYSQGDRDSIPGRVILKTQK